MSTRRLFAALASVTHADPGRHASKRTRGLLAGVLPVVVVALGAGCAAPAEEDLGSDEEAVAASGSVLVRGDDAVHLEATIFHLASGTRSMNATGIYHVACSELGGSCKFGTPPGESVVDSMRAEKAFNALEALLLGSRDPRDREFAPGGGAGSGGVMEVTVSCSPSSELCTVKAASTLQAKGPTATALRDLVGARERRVKCSWGGAAAGTPEDALFGTVKYSCVVKDASSGASLEVKDTYQARAFLDALQRSLFIARGNERYGKIDAVESVACQRVNGRAQSCAVKICPDGKVLQFGYANWACVPKGAQSVLGPR
ncbi:MAG: hypothetical protein JNL38_23405 [Myxococcales bacterium]|nr:hypothetical protein [Myxococcales bacterium]